MIATKTLWVEYFYKKGKESFPHQKRCLNIQTYSFKNIEEWLFNGVDCIIALLTIRIQLIKDSTKCEFTENRSNTKTRAFTQIRLITEF